VSDATEEYLPRAGEFDPLPEGDAPESVKAPLADGGEAATAPADASSNNGEPARPKGEKKPREKLIQFFSPSQLKAFQIPPGYNMVGDFHLFRGGLSVLAGPPSCGKSRAALWLALLGARGEGEWLGYKVHTKFRTLILQDENDMVRLHRDFQQIDSFEGLDEWVKISAPPDCSLALRNPDFRAEMKAIMRNFQPELLVVDPWRSCTPDSMEKDYTEALVRLREILTAADVKPASLVVHHLRKPKSDDKHRGLNTAHLVSGSNVLHGAARSLFVMQSATDDVEENRVVVTCCKCSNGQPGPRTVWERKTAWFEPVKDFDWEAFDNDGTSHREPKVKEEHIRQAFELGIGPLPLKQVAEKLQEIAGVGRSAAYEALKTNDGARFAYLLVRQPGTTMISLRQPEPDSL
jgi:hypothetical protein